MAEIKHVNMESTFETKNFESMAVKANLDNLERKYFEKLKAELMQILGGKTFEDIEKTQEIVLARRVHNKMAQILEFLKSKEINDEEMKEQAYKELLAWARDDVEKENPEEWLEQTFDLDELPRMKVRGAELDLSKTKVSYLPENLEVASLAISYTKKLTVLPKGIKLEKLYARYSEITTLEGVEVTKVIDIWGNEKIKSLPIGTKVEELNVGGSDLSTLEGVEVTKILHIAGTTKIKSLPSGTKVEELYVEYSVFSTLEGVEVTKILNIRGNETLTSLPSGTKVEELYAEYSGLSTLEGVEVTKILNINDNKKLKKLPIDTIVEELYARDSELSTLEGVTVTKILNISGNKKITRLPSGTKVENLCVAESLLQDLPDDLIVRNDLNVSGCSEIVKSKAREFYKKGQIGELTL